MTQVGVAGSSDHQGQPRSATALSGSLILGCIGVVYGDIGTSPLYAFREAVHAAHEHGLSLHSSVLGVLSLIFWALLLIVTIKYVIVLLRLDNKGEGGVFALMVLGQSVAKRSSAILLAFGIAGASFFFGDAVLTPAISVLSAVEGLKLIGPALNLERVAPALDVAVLPLTVLIIVGLFAVQSRGTEIVARFFGPIMLVWFLVLAIGGLIHILDDVRIFHALNPIHAVRLVFANGLAGFTIIGLVFLAVTGAEALYTDLGHFGRRPIMVAWLSLVFPALLLNYLGQGALVLSDPSALKSPLYQLYPSWALVPVILIATAATAIASQAVITGAFSIASQAIQLGLLPRLSVLHTSANVAGQIYMPRVNFLLLVLVLIVVLLFQTSSELASAYGVSVTAALVVDSVLALFVVWRLWQWPLWKAALLIVPLLLIEEIFFVANFVKLVDGGWVPVLIATVLSLIMFTWRRGSTILSRQAAKHQTELDWLVRRLEAKPPHRVPGTAIFLTADTAVAPTSLMHNLKHNRVLHERNIVLSIKTEDVPRVPRHDRIVINRVSDHFILVVAHYGLMETPNVPNILERSRRKGLNIEMGGSSFFLSRRTLRPDPESEMPRWQNRLFRWLYGGAEDATEYFRVPHDRVVEVGTQVTI